MAKQSNFFKKNLVSVMIVLLALLLEFFVFLSYYGGFTAIKAYFHTVGAAPSGIILFYGTNCQNCTTVDNFIKNNNVASKVAFSRLEVMGSRVNASILADKAQICGLSPSEIGVPFLWDGKNCIVGYVDVISFFKARMAKK